MNTSTDTALGIDRNRSVTGCTMTPSLHPDYAIGTRVACRFHDMNEKPFVGTITGVASTHIIFHYIVTLDEPLPYPGYKGWTTISVSGCQLKPLE